MFRIKRQLKKVQRQATPTNAFKHQLWTSLSAELEKEGVCTHRTMRFRFATVGVAVLVLVFGMGTGVFAYESPSVVDGHPLYFVKTGIESIQKQMMFSPEKKARFHAQMMSRRLEEGEQFLHDHAVAQQALEAAAVELERSVGELVSQVSNPEERNLVLEELGMRNARYAELAARVQDRESNVDQDSLGEMAPLKNRAHQWGLSDEELDRLFQEHRRVNLDEGGY